MKDYKCCICGKRIIGYGNNPEPIKSREEGRCCDLCDDLYVIPARIQNLLDRRHKQYIKSDGVKR